MKDHAYQASHAGQILSRSINRSLQNHDIVASNTSIKAVVTEFMLLKESINSPRSCQDVLALTNNINIYIFDYIMRGKPLFLMPANLPTQNPRCSYTHDEIFLGMLKSRSYRTMRGNTLGTALASNAERLLGLTTDPVATFMREARQLSADMGGHMAVLLHASMPPADWAGAQTKNAGPVRKKQRGGPGGGGAAP